MKPRYTPWPAPQDDLIRVSLYAGDHPVMSHMHNFIELVYVASSSCLHRYHNMEVTLIPGDVFTIMPHWESVYEPCVFQKSVYRANIHLTCANFLPDFCYNNIYNNIYAKEIKEGDRDNEFTRVSSGYHWLWGL